ncbi:MAG: hypothetical protein NC321_14175 [Clostridium sp.]|nr:hypothetical protein [Clostridium sp.]
MAEEKATKKPALIALLGLLGIIFLACMLFMDGEQGFFYLDRDLPEDINEYSYFKVYRHHGYSEITDNWYSYVL